MKDVLGILEHLGYRELHPEESAPDQGDWRPIEDTGGRFAGVTTDDVDVITRKRKATARLVDRDTGQLVATARKSCPLRNGAHG
jgi:hypothetical protein